MGERRPATGWIAEHRIALVLGLIIVVGAALRIWESTFSVTGDEVSTLYIVKNNGLLDAIRVVKGDAEITPPLNFALSLVRGAAGRLARTGPPAGTDQRHRLRSPSSSGSAGRRSATGRD